MPDAKWTITAGGRGMNLQQSRAMFHFIRRPEAATLQDIFDLFFHQQGLHRVDLLMVDDPYDMDFEDAQAWAETERDSHTQSSKGGRMTLLLTPTMAGLALPPSSAACHQASSAACPHAFGQTVLQC